MPFLVYIHLLDGDIWLGMYRPQTSQIADDFRYYSDGSKIGYQNWYPGNPSNSQQNCIMVFYQFSRKWVDIFCTVKAGLICEL